MRELTLRAWIWARGICMCTGAKTMLWATGALLGATGFSAEVVIAVIVLSRHENWRCLDGQLYDLMSEQRKTRLHSTV